jgi:RimJ/RimL family protein N-acetyltransferase
VTAAIKVKQDQPLGLECAFTIAHRLSIFATHPLRKNLYITMDIHPITLSLHTVRLEPLSDAHIPELFRAGNDASIWQYMCYGKIQTEAQMGEWVHKLLEAQDTGTDLPFAVIHLETKQVIGSTRYLEIQPHNRSLEIGGTWYTPTYQRTTVNTECKYLLLRHAFEVYGCVRIQFKADVRNLRSQRALQRIGAIKEGILRNHMILPDGTIRSSVFYSILDSEWFTVKALLEEKMKK